MSPQTETAGVRIMTPAQVLDLVATGGHDVAATLPHGPVLAVDVDGELGHEAAAAVRHLPAVAVGVASQRRTLVDPPDLDVLLTDAPAAPAPWRSCPEGVNRALSTLALSVLCSPQAATTLVQMLRLTRDLGVGDALVAESHAYAVLAAGPEFAGWVADAALEPPRHRYPSPVEVARRAGTLAVTLRRTNVGNTIDSHTRDVLAGTLEQAVTDGAVTSIELRGAGADFCRGDDAEELGTGGGTGLDRAGLRQARALWRCAPRTTARVHGACVGTGVALAAAAGRVVAAADASFRLPEVGMGLIPGSGGTVALPRRIGRQRAAWMALTGAPVDVRTAVTWGLVDVG